MGEEPEAGPKDYVHAAITSIRRGDVAKADDQLQRAYNRFPDDPDVGLWKVEIDRMQWRQQEALSGLQRLSRSTGALPLSRQELQGRIGDLLFEMGNYGESVHYLLAGSVGDRKDSRRARARLTRRLPYVRRHVRLATVEMPLREGELPEMVCAFGDKQRSFVLDTGASMTTVTKSLGKELGVTELVDAGLVADSLGRTFGAWLGVLPEFTLGEVELGPLPVLVVDDDRLALRDPFGGPKHPPAGVVGLDVLSRFRTTFDPDRRSVVFQNPRGTLDAEPDAGTVPLVLNAGCMQLPVTIEGVKLWFILDTGASHSSLTDLGLRALPGGAARATIEHRLHRTLSGTSRIVRQVPNLSLDVSDVGFTGMSLPVRPQRRTSSFPVHGVLGADVLMRCRVTIDRGWVTVSRRRKQKK